MHRIAKAALVAAFFLGACSSPPPPSLDAMTVRVQIGKTGHGSGVVIGDGTLVLTAAHVAKGATKGVVTIIAKDGREQEGRILWIAKNDDVALIEIDQPLPAAVVRCERPAVGEGLEIVGHPSPGGNLPWMHTYTQVGAFYDDGIEGWAAPVMVFGGEVYGGNSGGPMFNSRGEVVAIVVAMAGVQVGFGDIAPYGFNLAVPAWRICEMFP